VASEAGFDRVQAPCFVRLQLLAATQV